MKLMCIGYIHITRLKWLKSDFFFSRAVTSNLIYWNNFFHLYTCSHIVNCQTGMNASFASMHVPRARRSCEKVYSLSNHFSNSTRQLFPVRPDSNLWLWGTTNILKTWLEGQISIYKTYFKPLIESDQNPVNGLVLGFIMHRNCHRILIIYRCCDPCTCADLHIEGGLALFVDAMLSFTRIPRHILTSDWSPHSERLFGGGT